MVVSVLEEEISTSLVKGKNTLNKALSTPAFLAGYSVEAFPKLIITRMT